MSRAPPLMEVSEPIWKIPDTLKPLINGAPLMSRAPPSGNYNFSRFSFEETKHFLKKILPKPWFQKESSSKSMVSTHFQKVIPSETMVSEGSSSKKYGFSKGKP